MLSPSADVLLNTMIPNYLTGLIYGCLVEAYASENNARMMAMQSSTDSAKYNGKPIVNSTNGEPEKLKAILPLCKKYGAAIVGLAIDERGILPAAEDRVAIARRITEAALEAGIPREDIYIDCLTLTASAQQKDVLATVQALEACKKELGVRTILGVSNISFGLPCRLTDL